MLVGLPLVEPVDLVEGHHEWGFLLLKQVDRLDSLGLEAVHDVDHQDGDVTQGGAWGREAGVLEDLMRRCDVRAF